MATQKTRIETAAAPASTGFRSQGLVAGGVFFGAGQIGAAMPEPGVLREPSTDMREAVQITLGHLEQVTRAAGLDRSSVFEVSAFPKVGGSRSEIHDAIESFLGRDPELFTYREVFDVAAHALIEMDWMASADERVTRSQAAAWLQPLGHGPVGQAIHSGPFIVWNRLQGHGNTLGDASHSLLTDLKHRLAHEQADFNQLVKLTVYLYEFDPYPQFNEATKQHFADIVPPMRSVLVAPEITGSAKIVIDAVALAP